MFTISRRGTFTCNVSLLYWNKRGYAIYQADIHFLATYHPVSINSVIVIAQESSFLSSKWSLKIVVSLILSETRFCFCKSLKKLIHRLHCSVLLQVWIKLNGSVKETLLVNNPKSYPYDNSHSEIYLG